MEAAGDVERPRMLASRDKALGAGLHASWLPTLKQGSLRKYSHLALSHLFQPEAMETSGVVGQNSLSFLESLENLSAQESGESIFLPRNLVTSGLPTTSFRGRAAGECSAHPGLLCLLTCYCSFVLSF